MKFNTRVFLSGVALLLAGAVVGYSVHGFCDKISEFMHSEKETSAENIRASLERRGVPIPKNAVDLSEFQAQTGPDCTSWFKFFIDEAGKAEFVSKLPKSHKKTNIEFDTRPPLKRDGTKPGWWDADPKRLETFRFENPHFLWIGYDKSTHAIYGMAFTM